MTEQVAESYAVVVRRTTGGPPVLQCLRGVDGETISAVYDSFETAEVHRIVKGRDGHDVIKGRAADLADLLGMVAADGDLVALKPPISMEGGEPQPVRTIPVGEFLERLRGQESVIGSGSSQG